MTLDVLSAGLGLPDIALLFNRIVIGTFFMISGYHKLFNHERHAGLLQTFRTDHVPLIFQWIVPGIEFTGGAGVLFGFLAPLSACGLLTICIVATLTDGLKRLTAFTPIDFADYCDDVLYLPEVLYVVMLAVVIFAGPGPLTVDRWLLGQIGQIIEGVIT